MTVAVVGPAPVQARTATWTLALLEGRLLLRSPLLWTGVGLSAVLCTVWGWTRQPDWQSFTADAGMASLVLAGFLLLLGHQAASRDHRHGTAETASTLPTPARRRTLALLALLPVAALAGALAGVAALLALVPAWPAGDFDPWLALTTVTVPMTGAALGVAVGRRLPATAAGPLTLFASATVLGALPVVGSGAGDLPWLLFPVVVEAPAVPGPAAWHLGYLVAVLVAVTALIPLRHRRVLPAVVLVAAVAAAGVAVQHKQDERTAAGPVTSAVVRSAASGTVGSATARCPGTAGGCRGGGRRSSRSRGRCRRPRGSFPPYARAPVCPRARPSRPPRGAGTVPGPRPAGTG